MARKLTVNQHLVNKLGVRRALMVETFVMLWAMYAAVEGEDPASIDAMAEEIGRDRATLFRWQSYFREAFAAQEWQTPRDLLDAAHIARTRPVSVRQVGKLGMAS